MKKTATPQAIKKFVNKMIPLPPRPYNNFSDYVLTRSYDRVPVKDGEFPCIECGGRGYYYDPDDCDPIEGYKLAPRRKCTKCKGTKIGPKKDTYQAYASCLDRWKKERKTAVEKRQALSAVLKNMTHEEIATFISSMTEIQMNGQYMSTINQWAKQCFKNKQK